MRLSDLDATLEGTVEHGQLSFDCPLGHAQRICINVASELKPHFWKCSGEFPDTLTVQPSIHAHSARPNNWVELSNARDTAAYDKAALCGWHGFVINGEVTNA